MNSAWGLSALAVILIGLGFSIVLVMQTYDERFDDEQSDYEGEGDDDDGDELWLTEST